MKITNPDWHPEAPSQLTAAQRRNLRLLLAGGVIRPYSNRQEQSLVSLVRHELAVKVNDANQIPDIMKKLLNEAFSGRPGPVLLDIPDDIQCECCFAHGRTRRDDNHFGSLKSGCDLI